MFHLISLNNLEYTIDGLAKSLYSGLFDFSDQKQKAGLFGIQHQNDDLWKPQRIETQSALLLGKSGWDH